MNRASGTTQASKPPGARAFATSSAAPPPGSPCAREHGWKTRNPGNCRRTGPGRGLHLSGTGQDAQAPRPRQHHRSGASQRDASARYTTRRSRQTADRCGLTPGPTSTPRPRSKCSRRARGLNTGPTITSTGAPFATSLMSNSTGVRTGQFSSIGSPLITTLPSRTGSVDSSQTSIVAFGNGMATHPGKRGARAQSRRLMCTPQQQPLRRGLQANRALPPAGQSDSTASTAPEGATTIRSRRFTRSNRFTGISRRPASGVPVACLQTACMAASNPLSVQPGLQAGAARPSRGNLAKCAPWQVPRRRSPHPGTHRQRLARVIEQLSFWLFADTHGWVGMSV